VRSMDALPKAILYTCKRCTLTAGVPIVGPIANPEYKGQGRCFNGAACHRRAKTLTVETKAAAIAKARARLEKPAEKPLTEKPNA
jgi:hypothetical protein